jgi:putative flavoprotein involved in K+ transport
MARGIVTAKPEIYVLGLPFLYAATSDVMTGVGRDASYVARHIASQRMKVALVPVPASVGGQAHSSMASEGTSR